MDDTRVLQLTGRRLRKQPAVLSGYRKVVTGAAYPYVVADTLASVDGFVLFDVDNETLRCLDQYEDEGRLYQRVEVVVRVDGKPLQAMTYVGIVEALTT